MARVRLPYVNVYKDRLGQERIYFRRGGMPRIALPGPVGSPAFITAYSQALGGKAAPRPQAASKTQTFEALQALVLTSTQFKALGETHKKHIRSRLRRYCESFGPLAVADLNADHIREYLSGMDDTPAEANNMLKMLRFALKVAVEHKWRIDNPAAATSRLRVQSDGFHTWTEDEIAQFEKHWKLGTRQRLAFDLLIHTAQRRNDVVEMGPRNLRGGGLFLRQNKTGAELWLPVDPALQSSIDASAPHGETFLQTQFGKPLTANGFGRWFGEACDAAGLPQNCTAHGLRKAKARRLAEAGATANEIAAVTGHKSLKEVERYTNAADQIRLAKRGMARVRGED